jgi:hypothetical protein
LLEERESLQVRHLEEVPVDFEASLAHVRDHEILSIWKDVPYLRWRYAEHPSNDYTFHLLYRDTHPEGLIVTRDREHTIAICDVLHRTKAAVPTALLLTEVVRFYQDSQAQKMEFFGHDDGFFDVVFATAGFTREPASSFVFGGRVFDNPNLHDIFFRRQNWTISYGDTDVV